jgi:hypothetical protein
MATQESLGLIARRISNAVHERTERSLRSGAYVERTWGEVLGMTRQTGSGTYEVAVLYAGDLISDEGAAYGYVTVQGMVPGVGDKVLLERDDARSERRIIDVVSASAYDPMEFNWGDGAIAFGSREAHPRVRLYSPDDQGLIVRGGDGSTHDLTLGEARGLTEQAATSAYYLANYQGGGSPGSDSAYFLASGDSGHVDSTNTVYSTARAGTGTLTVTAASPTGIIGQRLSTTYRCYEDFYAFDTSSIPAEATITSAVLSVDGAGDHTIQECVFEARVHDWGAALSSADFVAGADLGNYVLVAKWDTATLGNLLASGYNAFTDVALAANIVKAGTTRLMLSSDRHRLGNTPTSDEYSWTGAKGDGAGVLAAKLDVEWSTAGTLTETEAALKALISIVLAIRDH